MPDNSLTETQCVEEIRRLLRRSVARRMVSDVPFGVFLSGGVDSSLNVALMAEQLDRPVETFSIGIEGDSTNEFDYARVVAQRFGANHHEILINDEDFISFLPRMAWYQDEPLSDPVCVPIYYLSKLARDSGVPVIQVGEGSDEIFAGYTVYRQFYQWNRFGYSPYLGLPRSLRNFVHQMMRRMAPAPLEDALRRAAQDQVFFLGNTVAFWDCEKARLFREPPGIESSSAYINRLTESLGLTDDLSRLTSVELTNRLPELLLMRVDKMSMANSIETRVPFLDEDLVEFALRIPAALKFRNGTTKYILKKAAEGIIPHETIYRRKQGFCGSATNILSPRLKAYAYERIMGSPLAGDLFDKDYLQKIFRDHDRQRRFNSFKIWNLLNLVLWHETWFGNGSKAAGPV